MWLALGWIALLPGVIGCDASIKKTCVTEAGARFCGYRQPGSIRTDFSGFRPGSAITLLGPFGRTKAPVGDRGAPDRTIGLLGGSASPVTIRLEGTAANGHAVILEITVK